MRGREIARINDNANGSTVTRFETGTYNKDDINS